MGRGDNLLATGLARGAHARGKRIAFGPSNSRRTCWDQFSAEVFRNNPNIAIPGTERAGDVEWIDFRNGHRQYNMALKGYWRWNDDFRALPGELFFDDSELQWAAAAAPEDAFIVIEPNVEQHKPWVLNKQWSPARYDVVASRLQRYGYDVVQLIHKSSVHLIPKVQRITAPTFRHALALLERAVLYIGSEGGMHHGAAAVDLPGVVLFGGFAPPSVLGYSSHTNLTGGVMACGRWNTCKHCLQAMQNISCDDVFTAARQLLAKKGPTYARGDDEAGLGYLVAQG